MPKRWRLIDLLELWNPPSTTIWSSMTLTKEVASLWLIWGWLLPLMMTGVPWSSTVWSTFSWMLPSSPISGVTLRVMPMSLYDTVDDWANEVLMEVVDPEASGSAETPVMTGSSSVTVMVASLLWVVTIVLSWRIFVLEMAPRLESVATAWIGLTEFILVVAPAMSVE